MIIDKILNNILINNKKDLIKIYPKSLSFDICDKNKSIVAYTFDEYNLHSVEHNFKDHDIKYKIPIIFKKINEAKNEKFTCSTDIR